MVALHWCILLNVECACIILHPNKIYNIVVYTLNRFITIPHSIKMHIQVLPVCVSARDVCILSIWYEYERSEAERERQIERNVNETKNLETNGYWK